MSNGGGNTRERRDAWALSREKKWHPIIRWYERGIHELQQIDDVTDPRSWIYLANIHGTFSPRRDWPSGLGARAWNACQHGSWYFLPWRIDIDPKGGEVGLGRHT